MALVLTKKPKNVTLIEGFPGFGLVSTITTGFLLDHLKCEQIGKYHFEKVSPMVAIHNCKAVDPVGVYYNDKYNIVIVHAITAPQGIEWEAAEILADIAKQLTAKELITIEGIGSQEVQNRVFFYTENLKTKKKFESINVPCIGEGIVVGVTGALLQKYKGNMTCIFTEAQTNMPDSGAAAKIIEILDKYLELKVDYSPLLKQAKAFEDKLKGILEQAQKTKELKDSKELSYLG